MPIIMIIIIIKNNILIFKIKKSTLNSAETLSICLNGVQIYHPKTASNYPTKMSLDNSPKCHTFIQTERQIHLLFHTCQINITLNSAEMLGICLN
jgi:hypothetical protein